MLAGSGGRREGAASCEVLCTQPPMHFLRSLVGLVSKGSSLVYASLLLRPDLQLLPRYFADT